MVTTKKKPNLFERIFQLSEVEDAPIEDGQSNDTILKNEMLGTYGTEVNAGYPAEEYLQGHRGTQRADEYDKMRRSDPQVVMCLSAVKNPIKSAQWEIVPGHEEGVAPSEEQIADADLVRHILFNDLDKPWPKVLSEILTTYDFGHAVFEITHKAVLNHPKFGNYNGLASFAWRSPRTIERFNLDERTGKLKSVTQIANGDLSKMVDIPAEFLIVFTINQEGANYEGISMLRPCYGPYKRKDLYLKLNAIGIEKFAVPTPIAKVPDDKQNSQQADNLKAVLEAYVSHDSNYLMVPVGWDITLIANDYDPSKVEDSVDREDRRMAKSFLANFLELGMSSGGAFALARDLSDFMLDGLEHLAAEVESPINEKLIPHLVKLNRGPRAFYPKLKHSGISDRAGKELADMLSVLGAGKWLTPEDGDEEHLRRRIGLPTQTKEGQRTVSPAPSFGAPPDTTALAERIRLAEIHAAKGTSGEA